MRALAILFLGALTAAAQSPLQNWANVRTLAPGTEVRVEPSSAPPVRGQLRSGTDETLVVTSGKGEEMFTRLQVARVSIKKQGHRRRNTLIGLGVGAGVGLAIGLAARCTGICFVPNGAVAAGATVAVAIVGSVVGAVLPTGGWREVYRQ
jgi:hypothetical protein